MKLENLRTGMAVKLRNGNTYFVLKGLVDLKNTLVLMNFERHAYLAVKYNNDLTCINSNLYDILHVFELSFPASELCYVMSFEFTDGYKKVWSSGQESKRQELNKELAQLAERLEEVADELDDLGFPVDLTDLFD